MDTMGKTTLSKRDLVGRISKAAVAASVGSCLVDRTGSAAFLSKAEVPAAAPEDTGVRVYNVRHYGAKGDGKALDTAAFQAAIDLCTKDKGGTVLVPAGEFLIGSIELKDNVTFHLAPAARLLGSGNSGHYKEGIEEDQYVNIALIYAIGAENVSIEGQGTVDGQGAAFLGRAYRDRPVLLVVRGCKNLTIRDISLTNSAFWCTHINQCSYVAIDRVRIQSRVNVNNDGFHFENCEHVKVSNCNVACEDDACALFGGNRDVTVTNCTFSTRWTVFRFGYTVGVSENISISNCVINDTFGCPIMMEVLEGCQVENLVFSNLVMNNVTGPIYIGLGSVKDIEGPIEARPGGIARNIVFQGIRATIAPGPNLSEYPMEFARRGECKSCINLTAFDGQFLENITFSDIHITFPGGGSAEEAARRDVPQLSGGHYFVFGTLPAYGMFARNVRGLTLNNVRFDLATPDLRPALVFDHVADAALNEFCAEGNPNAESLLRFTDSREALLTACRPLKSCAAFLQVEGTANEDITIAASDLSKAASPLRFSRSAAKEAVKLRS
jgi:hypothetical protein